MSVHRDVSLSINIVVFRQHLMRTSSYLADQHWPLLEEFVVNIKEWINSQAGHAHQQRGDVAWQFIFLDAGATSSSNPFHFQSHPRSVCLVAEWTSGVNFCYSLSRKANLVPISLDQLTRPAGRAGAVRGEGSARLSSCPPSQPLLAEGTIQCVNLPVNTRSC